jgi:hypothetical protein
MRGCKVDFFRTRFMNQSSGTAFISSSKPRKRALAAFLTVVEVIAGGGAGSMTSSCLSV